MLLLGILKAIGCSIILILVSILIIKGMSRCFQFEGVTILLTALNVILSTILLSVFFYSLSIKQKVDNVHAGASGLLVNTSGAVTGLISNSVAMGITPVSEIKQQLMNEYLDMKSKIESINIDELMGGQVVDGVTSAQQAVQQTVDFYFNKGYRKLRMAMMWSMIITILLQIIYIVLTLYLDGGSSSRQRVSSSSRQRGNTYRSRKRYY